MKLLTAFAVISSIMLIACGKKEEAAAPPEAPAGFPELVCSFAPSQSAFVAHLTGAAGGSAAAAGALAQLLGLTVVPHSSGALILTGGSGYIAGTIGAAATGPVLIGVGVTVAGTSGVVELLCAPRNHPEMVAKVNAAATEFSSRSKTTASKVTKSVSTFVDEQRISLIRTGEEAVSYANRKSGQISGALRN